MLLRTVPILVSLLLLPACDGDAEGAAVADDPGSGGAVPAVRNEVTHLDAAGAATLIAENDLIVVLDVRTPAEYEAVHIEGSVLLDFRTDDFKDELAKLDRTTPYLVHCRSGGRSGTTIKEMRALGFEAIYHLDGGMNAWVAGDHPVVKN